MKKFIRIHRIELVIAFFLSLIFVSIANYYILPFNFKLIQQINKSSKIFFEDVNNDGFTEKFVLGTIKDSTSYYFAYYEDYSIKDQYNLYNISKPDWIFFDNINEDIFKEILIFSSQNDSLFLTILDWHNNKEILHRNFIDSKPDTARHNFWDKNIVYGGTDDFDNDNKPEILFGILAGYSIYPRKIAIFDIEEKKITKDFNISAPIVSLFTTDFGEVGNKYIISATTANRNVDTTKPYNDQSSWLFFLDYNLKLNHVIEKKYAKFSSIEAYPNQSNGKKNILIYYRNSDTTIIQIIDQEKKIINEIQFNSSRSIQHLTYSNNSAWNLNFIFFDDGSTSLFDNNLNILDSTKKLSVDLIPLKIIEYSTDKFGLLAYSDYKLLLFDIELNLIAEYKVNEIIANSKNIQQIKNPFYKSKLFIPTQKASYLFDIQENTVYYYIYLLGLLLFLFLFPLIYLIKKAIIYIFTFFNYFKYSIKRTNNGILVINNFGKIFYYNRSMPLLNAQKIKRGNNYSEGLKNISEVKNAIHNSIETKTNIIESIAYKTDEFDFKGEVKITPFKVLNYTFAYLVEIIDYTKQISADRIKTWSATIQRMAHEIKTPLSSVGLGLDTLKNRLGKKSRNYDHDIDQIQLELKRIKKLTKNFLLFSNLEKPYFTNFDLDLLIKRSLTVFKSFVDSGLIISVPKINCKLYGDFQQLEQLLHILIENAIDASEAKGKIEILCEEKDNMVKISVTDFGKGISKEEITKIFEPSYTTKRDGTGIGLTIAKKIVDDHKGKIKVESKIGLRTTFTVYLPK